MGDAKVPLKSELEHTHTSAVQKHYNDLPEGNLAVRASSRIFYMRNFNNWIKSVLIADTLEQLRLKGKAYSRPVVADLGCGKGGDLLKWKKGQIGQIICADLAENSVAQCEERYRHMEQQSRRERYARGLFTATFHTIDLSHEDLWSRESLLENNLVDVASCQFALHYSFESVAQARCFLRNAVSRLRPGGFFIGTIPDACEIVRRFHKARSGTPPSSSFGNGVYQISFSDSQRIPQDLHLFGCQYDFQLAEQVNVPEFLVYRPLLEAMLDELNMRLVYWRRFDEFFAEQIKLLNSRQLIGHMQGLEPYPSSDGVALLGDQAVSYDCAKQFIEAHPHGHRIGTMSKEEWEAITLYGVFCFEKLPSTSNGS